MLKNDAAYKIAKRAKKATEEEANNESNKKVIKKMTTNAEEITLKKKDQKARKQRSRSTTKSQLMKKSTKTPHAKAIKYINGLEKQNRQAVTQPNALLNDNTRQLVHANGAFHFDDDSIDHGFDYIEPVEFEALQTKIHGKKRIKKQ
ncbi:Rab GDP dissociation inhibitor alpha [Mucor velutinosus]|uniref:Rab GDP dissociation inhibitor alpha n=1 Tax=Mucor velutinosus TaxID=708070 RepID=A0AAN7DJB2_9FUNG|nr:Rab GDP dissociation inhibitor alpha [Mucor velutinosus]